MTTGDDHEGGEFVRLPRKGSSGDTAGPGSGSGSLSSLLMSPSSTFIRSTKRTSSTRARNGWDLDTRNAPSDLFVAVVLRGGAGALAGRRRTLTEDAVTVLQRDTTFDPDVNRRPLGPTRSTKLREGDTSGVAAPEQHLQLASEV
jgi:hypothetical protein